MRLAVAGGARERAAARGGIADAPGGAVVAGVRGSRARGP